MAGCGRDDRGCKGLGGTAVGYWGRSVFKRLAAEQEFGRQRALLQDQILGTGIRVSLWQGVSSGIKCACYKETNRSADRKCKSCHGVINGYIPGYLKFGYNTLWMSVKDTDVTLTNTQLITDFKSAKIGLIAGAVSGTIESADKSFTRSATGSIWEYESIKFIRIEDDSDVVVEYSLNSGDTWTDIEQLPTANPSSGVIRFRATLSRTSSDIFTPYFEIVRARYSRIDLDEERSEGVYTYGPFIRIMNSRPFRSLLKSEYGDFPNISGMTFWTSGLSMFDSSIEIGSAEELLDNNLTIIEFLEGALAGKRFTVMNGKLGDPAATVIVTQDFNLREVDTIGPRGIVW